MASHIHLQFAYETEDAIAAERNIDDFTQDYGDALTYAKGRKNTDYTLYVTFNMRSIDFALFEIPHRPDTGTVDSFTLRLNRIAESARDYINVIDYMNSLTDMTGMEKFDQMRRELHLKMAGQITDLLADNGVVIRKKDRESFGRHMVEVWFEQIGHCEVVQQKPANPRIGKFRGFSLKPF